MLNLPSNPIPTPIPTPTPILATADWDTFVQSASSAVTSIAGAKHMLIAAGVLIVLYINLRLARWIATSIKFDPPHPHPHPHPQSHPHPPKHTPHNHTHHH